MGTNRPPGIYTYYVLDPKYAADFLTYFPLLFPKEMAQNKRFRDVGERGGGGINGGNGGGGGGV